MLGVRPRRRSRVRPPPPAGRATLRQLVVGSTRSLAAPLFTAPGVEMGPPFPRP